MMHMARSFGDNSRSGAASERAAALLELASLHYGVDPNTGAFSGELDSPLRRTRALELLAAHPDIARYSIHTAAICGDLAHVEQLLAADPGLAARPGGKEGWTPLLYVCYGRLPLPAAADNAVAIARVLLDCGADPNAHWGYHWQGVFMPWSAVCGAIGDGEGGPIRLPPHPRADELVALLLDRGADINQPQAHYNTMLRGDDEHWLRVFLERGWNAQHLGWPSGEDPPETLFALLLRYAAQTNQACRAALLLAYGADPDGSKGADESLHRLAICHGSIEVAELLKRYGARVGEPDSLEAFGMACHKHDRAKASELLAQHPALHAHATNLLFDAAATRDDEDLAELLLDLGVSPDAEKEGNRALHLAVTADAAAVTQRLLDRGADVDARDHHHRATPLAWALHVQAPATLALLASKSRDIFSIVAGGFEARLRELLQDTTLAQLTLDEPVGLGVLQGERGETPLFVVPQDEQQAIEIAKLLLQAGTDPTKQNHAGMTASQKARTRGLHAVADFLESAE
jgi:uncharacterized protein